MNTGAPQGCVLSPTLYTLYTNDYCVDHPDTTLIKFADDSVFQGFFTTSSTESYYFSEINRFVDWCKDNYLILNVSKTKEMVVDFRLNKDDTLPLTINGEQVETVQTYRYLGFVIDDKLNWHEHVNALCKKLNQDP